MEKKIDIHLRDEGLVIEGRILSTADSRFWVNEHICRDRVMWHCPCHTDVDTENVPRKLYRTTSGYFVQCPGCKRWYHHHTSLGYVEAVQKERAIPDELLKALGSETVRLIGCPTYDLADLPQRLAHDGLKIRPVGNVEDGDFVVFCISCPKGPTPGTLDAVLRCNGHTVAPLAIVLTKPEAVDDDSLRELVTLEEMELLSRIIPREEVCRLPLYYDFDPGLSRKLLNLMRASPALIRCNPK